MKLLHLDSSALGGHSVSRQLTAEIVGQLKQQMPGLDIHYHDLFARPLSHWAPAVDASDPAVRLGNQVLDTFQAADIVVIGAPMYNFSIPSQLKAWVDRIVVAGKTFRYTANGPEGLTAGKRVIIASSRGSTYQNTPIAAMDFQETYLRSVLGFIGVTDVNIVRAEGLAVGDVQKAATLRSARESISELASTLAKAA